MSKKKTPEARDLKKSLHSVIYPSVIYPSVIYPSVIYPLLFTLCYLYTLLFMLSLYLSCHRLV